MNRETLVQSLRPLLRWWWLIIAAAVVAGGTSLLYVRARPAVYQAHATLMVGSALRNLNPDSTQLQMGAYLARTYVNIAEGDTMQAAVKDALQMQWLPEYTVAVQPETAQIEVAVTDTDPQRAQAVAAELVHQIVLLSPGAVDAENRSRFAQEQLTKMEADISSTEAEIAKRQDELAKATSARQIVSLENEVAALEAKLSSLRDSYVGLLSSTREGAVNAINIFESPSLPTRPVSSGGIKLVLLATIMGGLLAAAGAYLLDFLDDSVMLPQQAEEAVELPVLGTIPYLPSARGSRQSPVLVMYTDPHTVAAEAIRVLRANVLFTSVDAPLRVLQITSPAPGEGKSSIAANLAVAMAQAGKRVILVDGDLRRPTQHRIFGLRNNTGITTALQGDEHALAAALHKSPVPGLSILTTGPLPPNPAELLGSPRMAALLETLQELCDLLVIDSPPVTAVADTAVLASQASAVLLVLWAGRTGRQQARYAVERLRHARAHMLGVVLNAVTRSSSGYPYYHAAEMYAPYGFAHQQNGAGGARAPKPKPAPQPEAPRPQYNVSPEAKPQRIYGLIPQQGEQAQTGRPSSESPFAEEQP